MQLKANALGLLFVQRLSIAFLGTLVGEISEVVRLKLDTIQLLVAAKLLYLLVCLLLAKHDIAVLIASELIEQVLLGELVVVFLLGAKRFGNGELRHNRA